jgi:hypothetical protein
MQTLVSNLLMGTGNDALAQFLVLGLINMYFLCLFLTMIDNCHFLFKYLCLLNVPYFKYLRLLNVPYFQDKRTVIFIQFLFFKKKVVTFLKDHFGSLSCTWSSRDGKLG